MADPSGKEAVEQDLPAPPGGPLRDDRPSGTQTPGEPARDPGPGVQRVTRDEGGSAPAPEPEGTEPEQDAPARALQEENAETSLDEPST